MITSPTTMTASNAGQAILTRESAMRHMVDAVFGRFTAAGIPWCILRNRDEIPDGLAAWKDIDILVPGDVTIQHLASVLAPLDPAQVGPLRRGHVSFYFPAGDVFLRLDILYGNPKWKSADFIDHQQVLVNRLHDRGYMVASPLHQAYIVWCSKLLWGGSIPAEYESMVADAARSDPDAFHDLFARVFGTALAHQILDLALTNRLHEMSRLQAACRRALWLGQVRRRPVTAPLAFVKQVGHGLVQRFRPSGLDVAFLGPDGAGKSSIVSEIAQSPLRSVAFKKVQTRLGFRQTLPPIRTIASTVLRRPVLPDSTHLDPHGATPHHPLVWMLKFGYYSLDQWLEQIWMKREMAHTSLILKDRHLMELPIDPLRYRYTGPHIIARLMARMVPQPSLVIVLDAPTEVLQARKQEVPFEETARQREAYRDLAERLPNGYVVNANQPLDDVVRDVMKIVNDVASARTRKRYGIPDGRVPDASFDFPIPESPELGRGAA